MVEYTVLPVQGAQCQFREPGCHYWW